MKTSFEYFYFETNKILVDSSGSFFPSDWAPVISGTPQGTILGPILFLSYINDIVDSVSSKIQLFTDDTKIYRELRNPSLDERCLQTDLNNLGKWAKIWQLRFNEGKCEAMRITHSRDKSNTNYKLGMVLKDVKSFKDLGIPISKDLTWSEHISTIVNKANQVLGLIRRTVGTANTTTFSLLYKTLVTPLLEYAAPVWNPYLVKDIHAIESVQRRASRLALRQKRGDMSYEERCDMLHWPSLSSRRTYFSLVECFKIVFGLSYMANHSYKLYCKLSRLNCFKYSFFNNVISHWNDLPRNVIEAGSLDLFKCRLKSFLKFQILLFVFFLGELTSRLSLSNLCSYI